MSREIAGKMRQYKRLLLSYADFKHAKLASSLILRDRLHDNYPGESSVVLEALNCSMIVAYCRPFSGNDSRSASRLPDLPQRLLKVLSPEEREIHDVVMRDRNTVLAHSDSEALQMEPVLWHVASRPVVVPLANWGLAPLIESATAIFQRASDKLLTEIRKERMRLEPELIPFLRVVTGEGPFGPEESTTTQPGVVADGSRLQIGPLKVGAEVNRNVPVRAGKRARG